MGERRERESLFRKALRRTLRRSKLTAVSSVLALLILFVAIFAPQIAPYDPSIGNYRTMLQPPSHAHLFGTDELGRDILSRVVHGTRITITIGITALLVGLTIGVTIGLLTGYFGGVVDLVGMRFIDILLSFPGILLAILISSTFGGGLLPVIIAIGLYSVPTFARITRGSVLVTREKGFVEAARAIGASTPRILVRHVLSNIQGPIVVYATLRMASAVLTTAFLSFLGVGVAPPAPEWGLMVNTARDFMRDAPHVILFPGMAIFITVLVFNLLGDGLRDLFDVQQQ
ncbi:MAG: ABC transporter permease [Candidatus Bipolaricaulis sp.]|nr:ABC transporter permease [Candidatus Bipolaricaulis sp.]